MKDQLYSSDIYSKFKDIEIQVSKVDSVSSISEIYIQKKGNFKKLSYSYYSDTDTFNHDLSSKDASQKMIITFSGRMLLLKLPGHFQGNIKIRGESKCTFDGFKTNLPSISSIAASTNKEKSNTKLQPQVKGELSEILQNKGFFKVMAYDKTNVVINNSTLSVALFDEARISGEGFLDCFVFSSSKENVVKVGRSSNSIFLGKAGSVQILDGKQLSNSYVSISQEKRNSPINFRIGNMKKIPYIKDLEEINMSEMDICAFFLSVKQSLKPTVPKYTLEKKTEQVKLLFFDKNTYDALKTEIGDNKLKKILKFNCIECAEDNKENSKAPEYKEPKINLTTPQLNEIIQTVKETDEVITKVTKSETDKSETDKK